MPIKDRHFCLFILFFPFRLRSGFFHLQKEELVQDHNHALFLDNFSYTYALITYLLLKDDKNKSHNERD